MLVPLAARNVCSIWKFDNCICEMMIHGEYTPEAVNAAPNTTPDIIVARKDEYMLKICQSINKKKSE